MKHLSIIGMLLLMSISSNAIASCAGAGYDSPLNGNSLSNKRVEAVAPGDEWNEDHCGTDSGDLYKVGAGTTVDPYALRGTWSSSGQTVTYNYTGDSGSPYTWTLWQASDSSICWENSGTIIATAPEPGSVGDCSVP